MAANIDIDVLDDQGEVEPGGILAQLGNRWKGSKFATRTTQ